METVLEIIHFIGIISFSAAGAMVAIDSEADWFGVTFLSVITCFGGGLIRDIIAGQAIDRVGVMLGLPFPAGPKLDEIALKGTPKKGLRATVKDGNCCLSGIENICKQMRDKGEEPENIAATCIEYIRISVSQMLEGLLSAYGDLPVVFSGGVSANSSLRKDFTERYDAVFGPKHLSGDNAVGIAYLASLRHSEVI